MIKRILIGAAIVAVTLPSLAQADGVTFAFDHRGDDNLFSFAANDPAAGVTQIGPVGGLTYSPFAMDFNPSGSTLYVVDGALLGTVDQTTGGFTAGPAITGDWAGTTETGLSIVQSTGLAYLSDASGLYTLDLGTGVATSIGLFSGSDPTGAAIGTVIDIAADIAGNLFAHDIGTDSLWSIDVGTAAATHVGFSGLAANFAQGMDFDPTTNLLYAAIYTGGGTGSYGTWDTTTGVFTEVLDLPSFPDVGDMTGRELEIAIRVPEPLSGGLLALSAMGLALVRRRR